VIQCWPKSVIYSELQFPPTLVNPALWESNSPEESLYQVGSVPGECEPSGSWTRLGTPSRLAFPFISGQAKRISLRSCGGAQIVVWSTWLWNLLEVASDTEAGESVKKGE
jgi:hypothetical protein